VYSLAAFGRMITDRIRTDAYAEALRREIKTGDVVADIGTGTGILALLACRFGARRVYAFEPSGVVELAREIAAANGFSDRIQFISQKSTESALPEPANLIVSDLRGILPFFDQSLASLIDARKRFLAPGGRMIPQRDTVWIAGVQAPELYRDSLGPWNDRPYDFDMSAGCARTSNTISQCLLKNADQLCLEARCLATLDYERLAQTDLEATISWTAKRTSQIHGMVLWFDSVVAEGVGFTNSPGAPPLIYRQAFFPWSRPLEIVPGDNITVTVSAKLVGHEYVWRWGATVCAATSDAIQAGDTKANGTKTQLQQSNFFAADFSLPELRISGSSYQPKLNQNGQVQRRILGLMEDGTPLEAIAHQLMGDFPGRFRDWRDAFNLVASASRTFGS